MTANFFSIRAWKPSISYKNDIGHQAGRYRTSTSKTCAALMTLISLILLLAAGNLVFADANDFQQPINVKADRSDFDEKAGVQTLSGNVEITQGTLTVKAEKIRIELKDGTLYRIIGEGKPIRFQQRTDNGEMMRGQSNRIEYNTQSTLITFSGDARFERPGQQLSGSSIMYNMSDLSFKASGDKKGRVNIVLQPSQIKR